MHVWPFNLQRQTIIRKYCLNRLDISINLAGEELTLMRSAVETYWITRIIAQPKIIKISSTAARNNNTQTIVSQGQLTQHRQSSFIAVTLAADPPLAQV